MPRFNPAMLENPAWVTKTLARSFETMEDKVPPAWMPRMDKVRPAGKNSVSARMKEFGCGAYGCVLPTLDKNVVLKVTSDTTEAEFAAQLATSLVVPVTTIYRMVMALPEKREGAKIFLLWREEAQDVGQISTVSKNARTARVLIEGQHRKAQDAYELIHANETGVALRDALGHWEEACEAMAKLPELGYLSRGMLKVYRDQHIFFGDVHEGNIGRAKRDGKIEWIITDPGHVAVLGK